MFQKTLVNHAKNIEFNENADLFEITEADIADNLIAATGKTKRPIGFMSE